MKRLRFVVYILTALLLGYVAYTQYIQWNQQPLTAPSDESSAFDKYLQRQESENSKILYLIDRFRGTPVRIIFDGNEYDSFKAALQAKMFLSKNPIQDGQSAEEWVKLHTYRAPETNEIMYFVFPDGEKKPVRDVYLEELQTLEKLIEESKKSGNFQSSR